ncbi:MAG TPA: RAMP superfamily CRISPR-associated protein [Dictyoglomaceae bacterium]|nr:RAMP superfamily CRISPR-associated protein [Dictyoglomaceae bacterium]HPU44047.1 RAMP superfamily CRISPR-associated protein [Dictyoglomaceae bacterium]
MIHDYYLSKAKEYADIELAKNKKDIQDKLKEDVDDELNDTFYPSKDDLENLPQDSTLIEISFTLKKPYISKDEGEFHIFFDKKLFLWEDKNELRKYLKKKYKINGEDIKVEENKITFSSGAIEREENFAYLKINGKTRDLFIVKKENNKLVLYNSKIFENPIVRDKFTGLPIVKPSTWKGHLRFAANKVEWDEVEKENIIKKLFGSESEEKEKPLKGRLYFFPTFFTGDADMDVITPLRRDTRTPARGPISLEVMKPGKNGDFYLLYVPYPKGEDFKEEDINKDLRFLAEALKLMFYVYGFSAKKTSGFGVIEKSLTKGKTWIKAGEDIQEIIFSELDELKNKIDGFR